MAIVYKCDICGETYPVHTSEELMYISTRQGETPRYTMFTCCPKCTRHILNFMKVIENHPNKFNVSYTYAIIDEEQVCAMCANGKWSLYL